ncbi:hypothetical protein BJ988_002921 [Nocardioides panzhihuensis]|uniref:Acyl-CoA dehydrogenase/oxidase N-terminal domain-containing protein n=1 Tax=Nocardioides panzhihuensis TaxID=860243 RepID=A0A7Z0ISY9_9ACTN|nr:hypothetical protein [Nocardioides panzhihuensis]
MTSTSDFDMFRISEEHGYLREAVRALAESKIAPEAAQVDENSTFPQAAYDALRAGDFHAPIFLSSTEAPAPTRSRPASSSRRWPARVPPPR